MKRGFTLVELIVVVVIISIFLTMVGGMVSPLFFKSEVAGTVTDIQSLTPQMVYAGSQGLHSSVFSFSVEIKTANDIVDFSSEDRQFAVVHKGDIIRVIVFKYPPWIFSKAGTYYNGRLIHKLSSL